MPSAIDVIRHHCLSLPGKITEEFPFDETTLVFKVHGKMFLLVALDEHPLSFNAKCDPQLALELREQYGAVRPGYHMNKKHWNTATLDGSIPTKEWLSMIDHSYDLVVASLPRTLRANCLRGNTSD